MRSNNKDFYDNLARESESKNHQNKSELLLNTMFRQAVEKSRQVIRNCLINAAEIFHAFLEKLMRRTEFDRNIAKHELEKNKEYNEALDEYYTEIEAQSRRVNQLVNDPQSKFTLDLLKAELTQYIDLCLAALDFKNQLLNSQIASLTPIIATYVRNLVGTCINGLTPEIVEIIKNPIDKAIEQFAQLAIAPQNFIEHVHNTIVNHAQSSDQHIQKHKEKIIDQAATIRQTLIRNPELQTQLNSMQTLINEKATVAKQKTELAHLQRRISNISLGEVQGMLAQLQNSLGIHSGYRNNFGYR